MRGMLTAFFYFKSQKRSKNFIKTIDIIFFRYIILLRSKKVKVKKGGFYYENVRYDRTEFIKELFDKTDYIEIQRNDLAEQFNCVPSQINYVISTRFKPAQGYYVESKRGGGGHITIKKMNIKKSDYIMHVIESVDKEITSQEVDIFISNLLSYDVITEEQAKLLKVATSDNVLIVPSGYRDLLRASIFKNMLINLV